LRKGEALGLHKPRAARANPQEDYDEGTQSMEMVAQSMSDPSINGEIMRHGWQPSVTQAGWTPRDIKLLGRKPDVEVARKIGRTVGAVSLKRQKLGIEAPLQPAWNENEIKLLGTKPDREVAQIVGRTVSAVQSKRLLLGIRSWRARTARVGEPG